MELTVGKTYRVHYSGGDSDLLAVLESLGGGWYRVQDATHRRREEFFLNLNQIPKLQEHRPKEPELGI